MLLDLVIMVKLLDVSAFSAYVSALSVNALMSSSKHLFLHFIWSSSAIKAFIFLLHGHILLGFLLIIKVCHIPVVCTGSWKKQWFCQCYVLVTNRCCMVTDNTLCSNWGCQFPLNDWLKSHVLQWPGHVSLLRLTTGLDQRLRQPSPLHQPPAGLNRQLTRAPDAALAHNLHHADSTWSDSVGS